MANKATAECGDNVMRDGFHHTVAVLDEAPPNMHVRREHRLYTVCVVGGCARHARHSDDTDIVDLDMVAPRGYQIPKRWLAHVQVLDKDVSAAIKAHMAIPGDLQRNVSVLAMRRGRGKHKMDRMQNVHEHL